MTKAARTAVVLSSLMMLLWTSTIAWAGSWVIQSTPNPSLGDSRLLAVATLSSSNAWSVGGFERHNAGKTYGTLIEHYDGSNWQHVLSPNVGTGDSWLYGVKATSASNVWAVGAHYDFTTGEAHQLIERYDGSGWTVQSGPKPAEAELFGINARSSTDAWAVGTTANEPLAEHFDGASWTKVTTVNEPYGRFNAIALPGSSNAWGVGSYLDTNTLLLKNLIEHWNGRSWTKVASPNLGVGNNELTGVSAVSASDIWAVGHYTAASGLDRATILHYDGTSWTVAHHPDFGLKGNRLEGVKAVSSSDVWAVGSYLTPNYSRTLIMHYDGTSWTIQTSPNISGTNNYLLGVASTGSANTFAVGQSEDPPRSGGYDTLAMNCAC